MARAIASETNAITLVLEPNDNLIEICKDKTIWIMMTRMIFSLFSPSFRYFILVSFRLFGILELAILE